MGTVPSADGSAYLEQVRDHRPGGALPRASGDAILVVSIVLTPLVIHLLCFDFCWTCWCFVPGSDQSPGGCIWSS